MSEQAYWLIERQGQSSPHLWLRIVVDDVLDLRKARFVWTEYAVMALAFHRQVDALAFMVQHTEVCTACFATEHITMEARNAQ